MIRAADGTLYTGIARDVDKRLEKHRAGAGSRYLRGRAPLKVVYRKALPSMSRALKQEIRIKRFTKKKKLALIASK